jgi:hypothetical protein
MNISQAYLKLLKMLSGMDSIRFFAKVLKEEVLSLFTSKGKDKLLILNNGGETKSVYFHYISAAKQLIFKIIVPIIHNEAVV